jgi:ferredoxin
MPTLTIDGRQVTVPSGATLLDAAELLGVDVPTLCFLKGYDASTSCLVCMVKVRSSGRLVPACATVAVDGMEIESETEELFQVRRTALELLLSDHLGDCLAPCFFACPAHMDIPLMLRQIGESDLRDAIATIKHDIALPAILGRICSKPCEKGCRRGPADGPVAVCDLKRFVADKDLALATPYLPQCQGPTGKRVAIVGAGSAGLAATYELCQAGHACTLLDDHAEPGGQLRYGTTAEQLPREVLDGEVAQILRLGPELRCNCRVGPLPDADGAPAESPSTPAADVPPPPTLEQLADQFDAVLVACGPTDPRQVQCWGLEASKRGIAVDAETFVTSQPGIFAAGNAIRRHGIPVRSLADGKEAGRAIAQYLAGKPIRGHGRPFSSRSGRILVAEMASYLEGAGTAPRQVPQQDGDYAADNASEQADRCLACGCLAHNHCKLEHYARLYGADPTRFGSPNRPHEVLGREASVLFEPGKCIKCELCVQIADKAGEPLGLTMVGRGFDVHIEVPFERGLDEALQKVAAECVAACPTAALSFAHQHTAPEIVPLQLNLDTLARTESEAAASDGATAARSSFNRDPERGGRD